MAAAGGCKLFQAAGRAPARKAYGFPKRAGAFSSPIGLKNVRPGARRPANTPAFSRRPFPLGKLRRLC